MCTDAIRQLNSGVTQHVDKARTVSTLEYEETVEALKDFYSEVRYSHRLVVAPTGSKMQSLGVSLFKQMQPDIQVIYPVAEGFLKEYTEGWESLWQIDFGSFKSFTSKLQLQRKGAVLELLSQLERTV